MATAPTRATVFLMETPILPKITPPRTPAERERVV
jgi:hypothetical protein